jgi:V-type H+-transporting ATPase subunit G
MSSSSAGVSELMDAEKKASTVVAEARAARSDRLKAAKAEAGAAVDDLRAALGRGVAGRGVGRADREG